VAELGSEPFGREVRRKGRELLVLCCRHTVRVFLFWWCLFAG
jgi:hypothetical protein